MRSSEDERIRNPKARHNGERTPEEIESEIAMARAEMSDTLDAIQRKLSPGQILDQALAYVRSGPGEFASNFTETIKQNPVPVALLGISLGWLMMAGRSGGRYYSGEMSSEYYGPEAAGYLPEEPMGKKVSGFAQSTRETVGEALGRAGETASGVQQRVGEMARGVRDTTGQVASRVRGTTSQIASSMRSTTSQIGRGARYSAQQARSGFEYMLNEQPLVLGALGIALGAALGAIVPATRREDELMGEARDDLLHQAKEAGAEQLHKVQRVAEEAGEAAKEEAERQSLDTGSESGNA